MLNLLQSLRIFILAVFVICSAIITSVAVWNLSIVQSIADAVTAKQVDAYLIFVGASGLLLVFPIIFCELASKHLFLVRVWFELLWVGAYWVMLLIGAAIITAQSNAQLCDSIPGSNSTFPSLTSPEESPCASSQVLQAFTWISAILLLGYFTLLSILTFVQYKEDPTILQCRVHRFPVSHNQHALKSGPVSPLRSRFRAQSPPIIIAPTPLRIANLRDAILNHRANLSTEYEIEHYQGDPSIHATSNDGHRFSEQTGAATSNDGHGVVTEAAASSAGHTFAGHIPQTSTSPPILQPLRFGQQRTAQTAASPPLQPLRHGQQPAPQPNLSIPLYHTSVKTAINKEAPQPPARAVLTSSQPSPPSPPPLGDWPRMDALSRPRTKRKPLPQPQPQPQPQPIAESRPEPPSRMNSHSQASRPQPNPQPQAVARMNSQTQGPSRRQSNPRQEGPSRRQLDSQWEGPSRLSSQQGPSQRQADLRQEGPSRMNSQTQGPSRPQPSAPPLARGQSQLRALPPQPVQAPAPQSPAQYTFDAPALAAALQPLASQSTSWRSKPTGPRRRSNSMDDG